MNFFRSCRYNIEPISKTKNVLEHIFETCIFKAMNFCLREKSFKSFSNEYIKMIFCLLAGFVQLIYWSGRVLLSFSFNSLNCISGLVLLCVFLSWSSVFYDHMTSEPIQICILFICGCHFI